jgi:histidine ammonia-lyase
MHMPLGTFMGVLQVSGQRLTLEQIVAVSRGEAVELEPQARPRIQAAREVVDRIISEGREVYGITTGFGKLSDVHIPDNKLRELQLNLVRSHACGVGDPLPESEVRVMLLLRANVLAVGCSGARLEVVEALLAMLNRGVHPVIPEQGSVGASGDLAPLAHLALVLIGEGEALYQGERIPGAEAMRRAGIATVSLEAKEGLAVLNGTQAMAAVGGLALGRAEQLAAVADISGAMTLDALRDTPAAFDPRIQAVRPHPGQVDSAANLRRLTEGSEIRESHRHGDARVQDAYSLRCMPQVHGAIRGALRHVREIIEIETGSATDNPLVFTDNGDVISGGNFHGAPLAMGFDYAAIAVTDLMSISERRIERLVNPDLSEGLPPFLTPEAGMCSGMMIPQVCAVALLNEAKVLSHPASVDNVPTSGGKEDHVSMGMVAATKLRRIVRNAENVLAIELIAAAAGLDFRRPLLTSPALQQAYEIVRRHSPPLDRDRSLSKEIEALACAIRGGEFGAV